MAGTVGTWWFEPEGRTSCCSKTVLDSLTRSVTYSLGSVCLGSLIVRIVQTFRQLGRSRRTCQEDENCLHCTECVFGCMPGLLKSINDWAYVYVGLYGYGFVDSAKIVNLFRSRGWTTGMTNSLVLILVNLIVGALTGVVSLVAGYVAFGVLHVLFYGYGKSVGALYLTRISLIHSFCYCFSHLHSVGVVFGIVLASIALTVVDGAVKTSIVCFAEAPREFEVNHPELYHTMTSAYEERCADAYALVATPVAATFSPGEGRSVPAATVMELT